jgi:hypothetical protein
VATGFIKVHDGSSTGQQRVSGESLDGNQEPAIRSTVLKVWANDDGLIVLRRMPKAGL